jgi:hypothetical protein
MQIAPTPNIFIIVESKEKIKHKNVKQITKLLQRKEKKLLKSPPF